MTAVNPALLEIAPSPQDLLDEARVGAQVQGSAAPGGGSAAAALQESPPELGDDALVNFTAAAQNWFNTERQDRVPGSIISVQQMLSTLVGSMTADATTALATAAEVSPSAALALTRF